MIEFKNVKFNIKNIDISNNISFSVDKNDVVCFLGKKNAGKSSILRLIAGIYKNYSGEILINGVDIENNHTTKIDLVHDTIEHDNSLTVLDYLLFYASLYTNKRDENTIKYIEQKLREFSLMSYIHTSIDLLDKESYKLVDLVRVEINNPDIILFDNLFFSDNIDYNNYLLNYVKGLIGKKTIIFAARNLNYIEDICDKIGILENGMLTMYGDKKKIFKEADIVNRFELKILHEVNKALHILHKYEFIHNVLFDDNCITFSIVDNTRTKLDPDMILAESPILKELVENDIKIYSLKRLPVRYTDLLGEEHL